jgi:tryptophanyl-tRNA synthetase
MVPEINPWSSNQTIDIDKLFSEFGIESICPVLSELPEIPYFMRRGIVIGHRDYRQIASAIRTGSPFHVLTGFMPSGHPHLGHLMVMKEVVWHVEQGGNGYVTIADREAHAVRGTSWEQCAGFGKEYLACLYALGFEGTTYFQSKNNRLKDLAFEAATKVNFSELSAIYGFSQETDLAHAESVITQVADILYPQVDRMPAPTIVPVGIDQDPHIRLTRGIAHKMRMFTIEERDGYISVRSKNAPDAALAAVHKAFHNSKKYEGHVDIRGAACADVSPQVREIELTHGGFGFFTPSSTYHIFMPGLSGGKMSSSIPESTIGFSEPEAMVRKKVMAGITGGRMTLEEQKQLGGEPEKCSLYLLNLFHMVTDDNELQRIRARCIQGEITCGQCKKETAERVVSFMKEFRSKMEAAAEKIRV